MKGTALNIALSTIKLTKLDLYFCFSKAKVSHLRELETIDTLLLRLYKKSLNTSQLVDYKIENGLRSIYFCCFIIARKVIQLPDE